MVIDGRTNEQFDEAHIAGALSTSAYDTGFATKVSRVAPAGVEIIVVAACDVDECEAAELLAAVGLRVRGFLEGGMTAWRIDGRPVERIELIDPEELARRVAGPDAPVVLDVRNDSEYAGEHIPDSLHIPYGDIAARVDELPRDRTIAAICRGGKRSGLAASILQREGFADVIHVGKGVGAWRAARQPGRERRPPRRRLAGLKFPAGLADISGVKRRNAPSPPRRRHCSSPWRSSPRAPRRPSKRRWRCAPPSARKAGPTFTVEAGGGRRTRILDFSIESGRCGSIYAPVIDAGQTTPASPPARAPPPSPSPPPTCSLRLELRLRPRGEGLRAEGLLEATVGTCHERVPLDLVSTEIRGGGRHT